MDGMGENVNRDVNNRSERVCCVCAEVDFVMGIFDARWVFFANDVR